MRLSLKFLNEFIDTSGYSDFEIADNMTSLGNEYETVEKLSSARELVIGEVLDCRKHPNSDHLTICIVDTKDRKRQIVCGAPNVRSNTKVIVALPGAVLNDDFEIKETNIRGEESLGMICSLAELGIDEKYLSDEDRLGIHILSDDAVVGADPLIHLSYDDSVIDFELTSNRADLLSILGMAYEANVFINKEIKMPDISLEEEIDDIKNYLSIDIKTENCPLYLARMVKDVKIKESPNLIKARLIASGIRPINNVVDISNYVMLEYGQPLHFFDYKTLDAHIGVRMAQDKEELTTLDGEKRELSANDIVITSKDKAVGLAGVMGALNSEIEIDTKDIVIESAIFSEKHIRQTANRVLRTEASNRFEKGLNPEYSYLAIERACHLLEKYADAKVIKGTLVHDLIDKKEKTINISLDKINKVLGMKLSSDEVAKVFSKLAFEYSQDANNFRVIAPLRRRDLEIEEDLIEEVGRVVGIDKIEARLPKVLLSSSNYDEKESQVNRIKDRLIANSLYEVITYSLTKKENINRFTKEELSSIQVLSPMSDDKKVLRTTLIPSLMEVYNYNYNHQNKDISIFEISNIYTEEGERKVLALLTAGDVIKGTWQAKAQKANYYYLKGIVIDLLEYLALSNRLSFSDDDLPEDFHPYQTEAIYIDKELVGYLGLVHPSLSKEELFVAELNLDKILSFKTRLIKAKEISIYPSVELDLSFIINDDILASDIFKIIRKAAGRLLTDVYVFDYYLGETTSIGFRMSFNDLNRTLEDKEIKAISEKIVKEVEELGAKLRDK